LCFTQFFHKGDLIIRFLRININPDSLTVITIQQPAFKLTKCGGDIISLNSIESSLNIYVLSKTETYFPIILPAGSYVFSLTYYYDECIGEVDADEAKRVGLKGAEGMSGTGWLVEKRRKSFTVNKQIISGKNYSLIAKMPQDTASMQLLYGNIPDSSLQFEIETVNNSAMRSYLLSPENIKHVKHVKLVAPRMQ